MLSSQRNKQSTPKRIVNLQEKCVSPNLSEMEVFENNSPSSECNIFSTSKLPSFSSEFSEQLPNFKINKKKRDTVGEKTTIATNQMIWQHEKNCAMNSHNDCASMQTNSKNNLRSIDNAKVPSLTSKFTLEGISNQNCSCLTLNTKQNYHNLVNDSQFPLKYDDINNLSETQIQNIIQQKMKMLDRYNDKIVKKKNSIQYK